MLYSGTLFCKMSDEEVCAGYKCARVLDTSHTCPIRLSLCSSGAYCIDHIIPTQADTYTHTAYGACTKSHMGFQPRLVQLIPTDAHRHKPLINEQKKTVCVLYLEVIRTESCSLAKILPIRKQLPRAFHFISHQIRTKLIHVNCSLMSGWQRPHRDKRKKKKRYSWWLVKYRTITIDFENFNWPVPI